MASSILSLIATLLELLFKKNAIFSFTARSAKELL